VYHYVCAAERLFVLIAPAASAALTARRVEADLDRGIGVLLTFEEVDLAAEGDRLVYLR
jgi:hypothetical protein